MSKITQETSQPVVIVPGNIDSNEKDYYINKINNNIKKLHEILISSIVIGIIDFCSIYYSEFLFQNKINIVSIFSLSIWSLICLWIFRYNYNTIDVIQVSSYKKLITCIYLSVLVCIVIAINLVYMVWTKIIFQYKIWLDFIVNTLNILQTICSIFSFTIFFLANSVLPCACIFRLTKLKKYFIAIGNLQGQEFSISSTIVK